MQNPEHPSLYERIGPQQLRALVEAFYARVAQEPVLRPLFPEDFALTIEKQEAFLTGFLGGPPLYHQRFGHPMMRARHNRFEITPTRAKAWLGCMQAAALELELPETLRQELLHALAQVAAMLVNTPE